MFVLFWVMLMVPVGGPSTSVRSDCQYNICVTLDEAEVSAEAGLCAVIPCSFSGFPFGRPAQINWFKCEATEECDNPVMIFQHDRQFGNALSARVSLLEYDNYLRTCSIIINDLTESDSGSYYPQTEFSRLKSSPPQTTTLSVKALSQKPTVTIPPLTEGQRATLTCMAPGLCSGSDPTITWKWIGRGKEDSHIADNITGVKTELGIGVTRKHISTLMFEASASQHLTNVTCKVSFKNNISTEETVTLNINFSPKILKNSGCKIQSDILTCVCISQGVPSPTITWPLLTNHTEYFIITTVSDHTVNSTISLRVTDYSHAVRCVSNNDAGSIHQKLTIIQTSTGENGAVQGYSMLLPWSVAAVSLIISVVCLICVLSQWKAGKKMRAKTEDSTYMSLQKTRPTSEYDIINQRSEYYSDPSVKS